MQRGDERHETAERAAQHRYRAKIQTLLQELQRLVSPVEDAASREKRVRRGHLSKTSILSNAVTIVQQLVLDDEVRPLVLKNLVRIFLSRVVVVRWM